MAIHEQDQNFSRTGPRLGKSGERIDNFGYVIPPNNWSQLFVCIIILILCGSAAKYAMDTTQRLKIQDEMIQEKTDQYKYMHGWTSDYKGHALAYCLFSNNGGQNWYAIKENFTRDTTTGEITGSTRDPQQIILGPVETVYPGLLKEILDTDLEIARAIWIQKERK
jgi:hypothetical protein